MKLKYEYVIFDVDGTLIDPINGITEALELLAKNEDLELLDYRNQGIIGPPMKKTLMRLYNFDEEKAQNYASKFREIYMNKTIFHCSLYPDTNIVLKKLHDNGIKIGIATYKRTDCASLIVKYYNLQNYIDFICGDNRSSDRTKADIIEECMINMKIKDISKVLMVGDTLEDFNGAKENNIDFCGVTYGYGFNTEDNKSENIKYLVTRINEILDIVGGNDESIYCK